MNREQIIAAIEDEINRLEQVRKLLKSATGQRLVPGGVASRTPKKKRILSADARQRIAAAQKRRWAKQKAAASNAKK
jgi:predicted metal-dependent enzyme (double-stranded beta helix superfamily)